LQAISQSKTMFSPQDIATKVLPSVMPILLDPITDVRNEAFTVVNTYMGVLQEESMRIAQRQRQEQAQQQGSAAPPPIPGQVPPAPKSSGSYMSGLTSWMSSSTTPTTSGTTSAPAPAANTSTPLMQAPAPAPMAAAPMAAPQQQFAAVTLSADDDGWGDDDDDNIDLAFSNIGSNSTPLAQPKPQQFSTPQQFDDDPFAAIGANPRGATKLSINKPKSGGALKLPKAAPATKLSLDNDDMADGWDDF